MRFSWTGLGGITGELVGSIVRFVYSLLLFVSLWPSLDMHSSARRTLSSDLFWAPLLQIRVSGDRDFVIMSSVLRCNEKLDSAVSISNNSSATCHSHRETFTNSIVMRQGEI